MNTRFAPISNNVLLKVELPPEKKTSGGIIIAEKETTDQKVHMQYKGKIVRMGPLVMDDAAIQLGSEVYFRVNGARAIHDEGWYGSNDLADHTPPTLRLIDDRDIIGIFEEIE